MLHLVSRVPGLIFECFLFTLVVVRFIRTRMHEGISSTPLLVVFVRDGTWAFVLMFGELRMDDPVLYRSTDSATAAMLWAALAFEIAGPKGSAVIT